MNDRKDLLPPSKYEEPACLLCMGESAGAPIPTRRVLEKLDAYYAQSDYEGAERHLAYWLAEARATRDLRGEFLIRNEQMGLFRKTEQAEKAFSAVQATLALVRDASFSAQSAAGTALVNAATVYNAFGRSAEAIPLFEEAEKNYRASLPENDPRFGGLYNNMALALAGQGAFARARALLEDAIERMSHIENGEGEVAVSLLNLADIAEAERGAEDAAEEIEALLTRAMRLLDTETLPHDAAYAYICEKCAPTFGYYGYFAYEQELAARAKNI